MNILAIDPGPIQSAYVILEDGQVNPDGFGKVSNMEMLSICTGEASCCDVLVIEKVASYGMPVGEEVFETVFVSGRFAQEWDKWRNQDEDSGFKRITRGEVKMHLCGNMRAKDANIRQALIDRYGGKEKAIGNKKNPGPLRGITGDCWSALAVAITYHDTHLTKGPE